MNSEINVLITGNAASLQAATDEASASLDTLGVSSADAAVGVDTAGASAAGASGGFDILDSSILPVVATMAALFAGFEGIKAVIKAGKEDIDSWNNAQAQIVNTLNNTHDAIGLTVSQLDDLAKANANNTYFTNAANLAALQTLLNYGAIGKEILPQASAQVSNLAVAFANTKGRVVADSSDMQQASKLLGKALEDPATGMTAFTRVGIKFTAQQVDQVKAMEKSGDLLGAQKLLLEDVTNVVNNKAITSTETYAGRVAMLHKNLDELSGTIVGKAEVALTAIGHAFLELLPTIEKIADTIAKIFKPAIDALVDAFEKHLMPVIEKNKAAFEDIGKAIAILVGSQLMILVGTLYVVIRVLTAVIDVFSWLINVIDDVIHWFEHLWQSISAAFDQISNKIRSVLNWGSLLYDAGKNLLQGFVHGIEDAAGTVFDAVKNIGDKAVSALKGVLKIFSPSQVFAELGANVGAGFVQGIQGTQDQVGAASSGLATAAVNGVQQTNTQTTSGVGGLPGGSNTTNNGGISIYVSGNLLEITGQDATNMMNIIARNSELTGLGMTTLTPTGGGMAT